MLICHSYHWCVNAFESVSVLGGFRPVSWGMPLSHEYFSHMTCTREQRPWPQECLYTFVNNLCDLCICSMHARSWLHILHKLCACCHSCASDTVSAHVTSCLSILHNYVAVLRNLENVDLTIWRTEIRYRIFRRNWCTKQDRRPSSVKVAIWWCVLNPNCSIVMSHHNWITIWRLW